MLDRACVTLTLSPHVDVLSADWFLEQVVHTSAYVNRLRTRSNCGCQTGLEDVITAHFRHYAADEHLCDEECAWIPGSTIHCEGQVIADCQRCARRYTAEWLGECCDQCGSDRDGHFVVAGLGDVNVIARLCHECGPVSLSPSAAA